MDCNLGPGPSSIASQPAFPGFLLASFCRSPHLCFSPLAPPPPSLTGRRHIHIHQAEGRHGAWHTGQGQVHAREARVVAEDGDYVLLYTRMRACVCVCVYGVSMYVGVEGVYVCVCLSYMGAGGDT